jgi:MbtH protein
VDNTDQDRIETYVVLVNDEEQHSLWPSHKNAPTGWHNTGVYGTKAECLEYVEKVWVDITPLSVRKRLANSVN